MLAYVSRPCRLLLTLTCVLTGSELQLKATASALSLSWQSAAAGTLELSTADIVFNCHEASRADAALFPAHVLVPVMRHVDLLLINLAASVFAGSHRQAMLQPVDWHMAVNLLPGCAQVAVDAALVPMQLSLDAIVTLQMLVRDTIAALQVVSSAKQPGAQLPLDSGHRQVDCNVMEHGDDLRCGLFQVLPHATQSPGEMVKHLKVANDSASLTFTSVC